MLAVSIEKRRTCWKLDDFESSAWVSYRAECAALAVESVQKGSVVYPGRYPLSRDQAFPLIL